MPRVLIASRDVQGSSILIQDPKILHHLVDVLRLKPGDPLECFDGRGHAYQGSVSRQTRQSLTVQIHTKTNESPSPCRFILSQALIRPERFEWVLEKATELGVAQIIPMITARSTLRRAAGISGPRLLRWRRIMESSAAQCGRATVPELADPQSFEQVLAWFTGRYTVLLTLLEQGTPLGAHAQPLQAAGESLILVGPEGDFSPEEVALATQHGAHPASLGHLTLRSETAAVAALAILQHAIGTR